jgi:hypothetical protein
MNLILLSGNNIEPNKEWIQTMEKQLKAGFETTTVLEYDHWETGDELIDLVTEQDKLAEIVRQKRPYCIFAKSVGVFLALKSVYEGSLRPEMCVFVGTSVLWAHAHDYDYSSWLANFTVPSLFIQHTKDPLCGATMLEDYLQEFAVENYILEELSGNTHDYTETALIGKLSHEFFFEDPELS